MIPLHQKITRNETFTHFWHSTLIPRQVVIKWQHRKDMKVTYAVVFGTKVSCILKVVLGGYPDLKWNIWSISIQTPDTI